MPKNDLSQFDDDYLKRLNGDQLLALSKKLLSDLRDLHDRLGQNSTNSSIPSGSQPPWINATPGNISSVNPDEDDGDDPIVDIDDLEPTSSNPTNRDSSEKTTSEKEEASGSDSAKNGAATVDGVISKGSSTPPVEKRKPGKQVGAQGFGRTQKLIITEVVYHRATCCHGCSCALDENTYFEAKTGHYIIDIRGETTGDGSGIILTNTKHVYGDTFCPSCGHKTQIFPARCEPEEGWKVELTEWHLIGPRLMSLICCLSMRMRLSRVKIQEFLWDWIGLSLSVGTINQCIHEAGRAVAPLEEELQKIVREAALLYVDETSWKISGKAAWLWVFIAAQAVYFTVGSRGAEVLKRVVGSFSGWLMSDGYITYRHLKNRLRCWAHLIRKAKGLSESLNPEARDFGKKILAMLDRLKEAVYKAREGPSAISEEDRRQVLELYMLCLKNEGSLHDKTSALACEFLNDWNAIWTILDHPKMPLTNNDAERALRHWVIARRISHGTRTSEGTTAFTLLASVIETCRKRNVNPWPYLSLVIRERRQGNRVPNLPQAV